MNKYSKNNLYIEKPVKQQPNKLSYDDIMKNMGMTEYNGKLYFLGNSTSTISNQQDISTQQNKYIHNSYIYNKYFKDYIQNDVNNNKPQNIIEYRNMLIKQIINNYKAKQLKNGKIKVPTDTNINYNLTYKEENKLFDFSKRL